MDGSHFKQKLISLKLKPIKVIILLTYHHYVIWLLSTVLVEFGSVWPWSLFKRRRPYFMLVYVGWNETGFIFGRPVEKNKSSLPFVLDPTAALVCIQFLSAFFSWSFIDQQTLQITILHAKYVFFFWYYYGATQTTVILCIRLQSHLEFKCRIFLIANKPVEMWRRNSPHSKCCMCWYGLRHKVAHLSQHVQRNFIFEIFIKIKSN